VGRRVADSGARRRSRAPDRGKRGLGRVRSEGLSAAAPRRRRADAGSIPCRCACCAGPGLGRRTGQAPVDAAQGPAGSCRGARASGRERHGRGRACARTPGRALWQRCRLARRRGSSQAARAARGGGGSGPPRTRPHRSSGPAHGPTARGSSLEPRSARSTSSTGSRARAMRSWSSPQPQRGVVRGARGPLVSGPVSNPSPAPSGAPVQQFARPPSAAGPGAVEDGAVAQHDAPDPSPHAQPMAATAGSESTSRPTRRARRSRRRITGWCSSAARAPSRVSARRAQDSRSATTSFSPVSSAAEASSFSRRKSFSSRPCSMA